MYLCSLWAHVFLKFWKIFGGFPLNIVSNVSFLSSPFGISHKACNSVLSMAVLFSMFFIFMWYILIIVP